MKKLISALLTLALVIAVALSAASCILTPGSGNGGNNGGNGNGGGNGGGGNNGGSTEPPDTENYIYLVKDGAAEFQFITGGNLDPLVYSAFTTMKEYFSELGIETTRAEDYKSGSVSDCEILLGDNLMFREGCAVDVHTVGDLGYVIKTVGDRVVIAPGSPDIAATAVNKLLSALEVRDDGRTVRVPRSLSETVHTEYELKSIALSGYDISLWSLYAAPSDKDARALETAFRDTLYKSAGAWLEFADKPGDYVISFTAATEEETGGYGFLVSISGKKMTIACSVPSLFAETYSEFMNEVFLSGAESVSLPDGYSWSRDVTKLYYSDFGAVGDGVTDDFLAIKAAHTRANQTGQRVYATPGATYYIGAHPDSISVKTDTVWTGASFIFDDRGIDSANSSRGFEVFMIESDYAPATISDIGSLRAGQTNIGVSLGYPALVYLRWSGAKKYIRYGANQDNGQDTQEIILVDADGNVDPSTPILWDYDEITQAVAYRADVKGITLTGGTVTTRANAADVAYYYRRGIAVYRSNTVIIGVKHYITDEGNTGAPYMGFFGVYNSTNVEINSCVMTGHKVYSSGTYDTYSSLSNDVRWVDCVQSQSTASQAFRNQRVAWGVHASNYSKNLSMTGCTLSRFDAHKGCWNATIKDSTIGIGITIIGGGDLVIENVTRYGSVFLTLREDYGATWDGDIHIKNCRLEGAGATAYVMQANYVLSNGTGHWFGYKCTLAKSISVDGFTVVSTSSSPKIYVLSPVVRGAASTYDPSTDTVNPYALPTSVTVRNVTGGTVSLTNSSCNAIKNIPYIKEQ